MATSGARICATRYTHHATTGRAIVLSHPQPQPQPQSQQPVVVIDLPGSQPFLSSPLLSSPLPPQYSTSIHYTTR